LKRSAAPLYFLQADAPGPAGAADRAPRGTASFNDTQEEPDMANIARYDPFDLFEGVVKSVLRPGFEAAARGQNAWSESIPMDVMENDTSYTVWAELPGVKKEDVSVSIMGTELSLTAEVKRENAVDQGQGKETLLLGERRTGTLSRHVRFGAEIDDANASAEYRDGMLILTLPKKPSSQVKRLAIH
jgi:HSP20 family protein